MDCAAIPSPRGDGAVAAWMSVGLCKRMPINGLRSHPLSERGEGTARGRSDSEAVNKKGGVCRTDTPCLQHMPTSTNQKIQTKFSNNSTSRISDNYPRPAKL